MLTNFIGHVFQCIEGPPRTTLAWYWDEVELLGRCVYEALHLNCTDLYSATLRGEKPSLLGLMTSAKSDDDLDALEYYVNTNLHGNWSRLNVATIHPVEAGRM